MGNLNIALTIDAIRTNNVPSEVILDVQGGKFYNYIRQPGTPKGPTFWMVIFDRRTLVVAENFFFRDNSTVPKEATKYLGDTNYLYVLTTQRATSTMVPTGGLYKWLRDEGAGRELSRIEQASGSLNCGAWVGFAYTIVDIFGPRNSNTFEFSALVENRLITTLELMPADIGGTTYYSPVELG